MGTNYYAQVPTHEGACNHCSQADRVHIGKSLVMFQGYDAYGAFGPIRSWADWKRVLRETEGLEVYDEYGTLHDIEAFIADVEATERTRRRRQYDWVRSHPNWMGGYVDPARDWLDSDGFSFTISEFS